MLWRDYFVLRVQMWVQAHLEPAVARGLCMLAFGLLMFWGPCLK